MTSVKVTIKRPSAKYVVGFLIALVCLVLLMVLVLGAPVVTLKNDSGKELASIFLTGTGFSQPVPNLASGTTTSVVVHPSGDSGLKIQFLVDGVHQQNGDLAYIQDFGGYCVIIRIADEFVVSSDVSPLPIFCPKLTRLIPWREG